jgi:predicted SnoaL-like aldol condensation-catalyzing enzyme
MIRTTPEQNKALVLEAFDTLFNKRDYDAASRFWSDKYTQHSAHIEPGREGLFNLIKASPASLYSQAKLSAIARQLNEKPRKTLLYQTRAEKFAECVAAIS